MGVLAQHLSELWKKSAAEYFEALNSLFRLHYHNLWTLQFKLWQGIYTELIKSILFKNEQLYEADANVSLES